MEYKLFSVYVCLAMEVPQCQMSHFIALTIGPDGKCIFAAWTVSLFLVLNMTDRNQTSRSGRVPIHFDVQREYANWQMCFSGQGNAFRGTLLTSFEDSLFSSCTSKASLLTRSTFFITLLCSLRHSSFFYRRPTALMRRSWYFQATNWLGFKAWPGHVCPLAPKVYAFGPIFTNIRDGVIVCGP